MLWTAVLITPLSSAVTLPKGIRTSPCCAQLPLWMCMAWLLPGVKPDICSLAVTIFDPGSQLRLTVPDGSLPRGTMICPGPDAAAVVLVPEVVAAGVLDDVELDPHPAATTATTAAVTNTGALDPTQIPTFVYLSDGGGTITTDCSSRSSLQKCAHIRA